MQIEDSDAEEEEDGGMDREKIANQLFDGDDVSVNRNNVPFISFLSSLNIHKLCFLLHVLTLCLSVHLLCPLSA